MNNNSDNNDVETLRYFKVLMNKAQYEFNVAHALVHESTNLNQKTQDLLNLAEKCNNLNIAILKYIKAGGK